MLVSESKTKGNSIFVVYLTERDEYAQAAKTVQFQEYTCHLNI